MTTECPKPNDKRFQDITGRRFGRLVVAYYAGRSKHRKNRWACRCDCGGEALVPVADLLNGHTQSCGCLHTESLVKRCSKHDNAQRKNQSHEYRAWASAKVRCTNPKGKAWIHYGGRGIKMCERWAESFEAFLADMGSAPSDAHTIDRIDPNGNYEPSNCRWATRKEQARNTRANRMVTYSGETRCVTEWAEIMGVPCRTIIQRLNTGWSVEEAMTRPV